MNNAIKQMLERYELPLSCKNMSRLFVKYYRKLPLLGSGGGNFLNMLPFYGGTALRIFYGLDRFLEDLDFTLLTPNPNWSWQPFGKWLKMNFRLLGLKSLLWRRKKKRKRL